MENNQTPKLYPAWREALSQLEQAGIAPGQTIDREWVERAFGIEPAVTVADYEKNRQLFRRFFWDLRTELLKKHRLLLRAVNGVGYEVIHPQHQTARAMQDRGEEVARALQKLADEISYVRTEELDNAQRKANLDAQAKVGALIALSRKKLALVGAVNSEEATKD